MNNDTLTRARAVLATIRATREAGYLAARSMSAPPTAPALAIDRALAELAALDGGEVGE